MRRKCAIITLVPLWLPMTAAFAAPQLADPAITGQITVFSTSYLLNDSVFFNSPVTTLGSFGTPLVSAGFPPASAAVDSFAGPDPTISAQVRAPSDDAGQSTASAHLNFGYNLEIVGPAATTIPVFIFANANTQASGAGADATASFFLYPDRAGDTVASGEAQTANSFASPFSPMFTIDTEFMLTTQTVYDVALDVNVTAGGDAAIDTASASVDPLFVIDPNFPNADEYSIITSPGVGNGATPVPMPVPEPASWSFLTTALVLLGLVSLRARRPRNRGCAV